MATQKGLTSLLIPKPLHKRLKAVVEAKGDTLLRFITLEIERAVAREEKVEAR
jgi:hypothetical protein